MGGSSCGMQVARRHAEPEEEEGGKRIVRKCFEKVLEQVCLPVSLFGCCQTFSGRDIYLLLFIKGEAMTHLFQYLSSTGRRIPACS